MRLFGKGHSQKRVKVAVPVLLAMLYWFSPGTPASFAQDTWHRDSVRIVRKTEHNWPVKTKGDYRRFYKLYSQKDRFERLIRNKDSAWIKALLPGGKLTGRDLFDLTFNNMSGDDFSYALLYPISFGRIRCKEDEWYLSQFGIIFNEDGNAVKMFDHQARGYTLQDKSSARTRKNGRP